MGEMTPNSLDGSKRVKELEIKMKKLETDKA